MRLFVIITSYKEEATIGKAVEQIVGPNKHLWPVLKLIVVSPDKLTLEKAQEVCQAFDFKNLLTIEDAGQGKACALNLAIETIRKHYVINEQEDLLILTDGDMFIDNEAVNNLLKKIADLEISETSSTKKFTKTTDSNVDLTTHGKVCGGVGGHPVSLDGRATMFGYFSHLFCEAAHQRRQETVRTPDNHTTGASFIPMSGYLYAIRPVEGIFPIPAEIRAEDAYISQKLVSLGYKIAYAPKALAYVKFPKNLRDWYKQKTRSLGGNVQIRSTDAGETGKGSRSIFQDLKMTLFPLAFAKNGREVLWSLLLYPLRLGLWLKIYYNHTFNRYKAGMWERIESSK